MSKTMSLSTVTTSVTISAKELTAAKKGLVQQYWEGIWVYVRVISVFLVVRLTMCHTKFIVYMMFSDIIKEATTAIAKLGGFKVYQVILQ